MYAAATNLVNKLSMYRLVSIGLSFLWATALGLAIFNIIAYSPLAMISSVAVLFLSVYGASKLFGLLFGIRIHGESSFITALILFFIFTPTLELSGLLALMLTGILAATSKFLLTYKGRHIFNPAAVAAFIVSLAGFAFASWWVATPPLLPITLAVGLLILYKTRRRQIVFAFLAIAVSLVMLSLLSEGNSIRESLGLLSSWPFLFFACFMLTEPLTLASKRWQQFTEVGVVAVLFAVPIHLGDYTTTPALALLIGNLIAFSFNRRPAVALQLVARKQLTPSTTEFSFTPNRSDLHFEAGQYIEVTVPHAAADFRGTRRVFSVTSAPADSPLTFAMKFYEPSSTFKRAIAALPIGTVIHTTNIGGSFTLPKDGSQPLLFIAGGIGITPFISHLRHLHRQDEKRDIVVLYLVSTFEELAFRDVLVDSGVKVIVVTAASPPRDQPWIHMQTSRLSPELMLQNVPDIANRRVYISGPPEMVNDMKKTSMHLRANAVVCDYFIGY